MEERMRPNILSSPRPLLVALGAAVLATLCSMPAPSGAAKLAWRHLTPGGGPGPRWGQKAVYDRAGQRILFVGGAAGGGDVASDTMWALGVGSSEPTWSRFSTSVPKRFDCSVSYDPRHRRIVLFGGEEADTLRSETFFCDSAGTWTNVTAAAGNSPCERYEHASVYDPVRSAVVMHAGELASTGEIETYDTWRLPMRDTVAAWESITEGNCTGDEFFGRCSPKVHDYCSNLPTPRSWHAMAADSAGDFLLLDEGWYLEEGPGAEVWGSLGGGGTSWTEYEGPGLDHTGPGRMRHAIDYDTRDRQFVMYGGDSGSGNYITEVDTLTTSTKVWGAVADTLSPPGRDWHAMAYDVDYGRVVVFGGRVSGAHADGEVWEARLHDGPTIRPAPIVMGSTPTIVSGGVTLGWTDSGADSLLGRAVKYDLRYSTSLITSANFGSATQDTLVGVPDWPGTAQSFTVTGLSPSTGYYFAIKAQDAWGNWSAISNVVSACTDSSGIRPAAITLGGEEEGGFQAADLSWYAVGADSLSCTATAYDLRKSQSNITTSNFSSATQVSGLPTPAAPGTFQTMHVTGLGNCHLWYFALKVRDSWGNWSAMSNVFSATTICFGDGTKPTDAMPVVVALGAPRPSPTVGGTTLRYDIPLKNGGDRLDLAIYDVRGRLVKTLWRDAAVPGTFTLTWDRATNEGPHARPGIYFIRMSVGTEMRTQTLILQ
jgi:hypothetical protein